MIRRFLPLSNGVAAAAVGLATCANTALGLGMASPVGLATCANAALALGSKAIAAAGLASGTNTALGLSPLALRSLGLASDTETALTRPGLLLRAAGLGIETDTPFALLSGGSALPAGRADETETAFGLGRSASRAAGRSDESDTAVGLGTARAVGLAVSANDALPLTYALPAPVPANRTVVIPRLRLAEPVQARGTYAVSPDDRDYTIQTRQRMVSARGRRW